MANDGFVLNYAPPHTIERTFLASAAFVALLLLVFVGLDPFSPPSAVSSFGGVAEMAQGGLLRQACYLSVFAVILVCALQRRSLSALGAVPVGLGLLLAWCLLSASWAAEPAVALRRAGLEVVIVLSVLLSVETIGAERAFRLWRILLAVVLVVNWVSIPLIATARHLPGEVDLGLVGDWRGLYGHKNIAGAVCVMTILLFLFTQNGWRNWFGILVAIAAAGFLVMTRSKTSLGFLPLALAGGAIYRIGWRDSLSRAVLSVLAALLLLGLITLALLNADAIAHALEDPAEFTGRSAIWAAEFAYIRDHPMLGAGFGTFADTGGASPLHAYITGSWVEQVSHGHNGYLQLAVTIGGVGFALAMLSLIAAPLKNFWTLNWRGDAFRPLLFALFLFLVLHNFMESDFLEGDGVTWVAFLLVLASARAVPSDKSLTGRL